MGNTHLHHAFLFSGGLGLAIIDQSYLWEGYFHVSKGNTFYF